MSRELKAGDRIRALEGTQAFFWSEGREGVVRIVHDGNNRGILVWGDDPTTLGFNCIDVVKIDEVVS